MSTLIWIWGGVMTCFVILLLYWVQRLYVAVNIQIGVNDSQKKLNVEVIEILRNLEMFDELKGFRE